MLRIKSKKDYLTNFYRVFTGLFVILLIVGGLEITTNIANAYNNKNTPIGSNKVNLNKDSIYFSTPNLHTQESKTEALRANLSKNFSLMFNGHPNFIGVDQSPSINLGENMTIEFWIKTNANVGGTDWHDAQWIFDKDITYEVKHDWAVVIRYGKIVFNNGNPNGNADQPLLGNMEINDGFWHHVAITRNVLNGLTQIFIDGILDVQDFFSTSNLGNTLPLYIGCEDGILGYPIRALDGELDDLRLWNIVRTQDEINSDMFIQLNGSETGLVAYWPFDEGSGQIITDLTPNNNIGGLGNLAEPDEYDPVWILSDITYRFLDLPFEYEQHPSLVFQNHHVHGKITSWFDHNIPTYPVTLGNGVLEPYFGDPKTENGHIKDGIKCYEDPEYCYDDHDGYDFGLPQGSAILAAADGVVHEAGCGEYGYQVVIEHPNKYYSLYGHLSEIGVSIDQDITMGQQIGVMGGTFGEFDRNQNKWVCGNKWKAHLHFGLYRDVNGDADWSADEVVDPSGWAGSYPDPVVTNGYPANSWLWIFDREKDQGCGSTGCNFVDLAGDIHVSVPSGYFASNVNLTLFRGPINANPPPTLKSIGYSFRLQLLEFIQKTREMASQSQTNIIVDNPVVFTIMYSDDSIQHLDESNLALFRWNELGEEWELLSSSVNTVTNMLNAETLELGEFDAQAPVLCTEDTYIHDDNYFGAELISTYNSPTHRLFDTSEDEDWFMVDAIKGATFSLETLNLAQGVDTNIELYDVDGTTLLAFDDNGGAGSASKLVWIAPDSGFYFYRISRNDDSVFGCNATYDLKMNITTRLYLPLLNR